MEKCQLFWQNLQIKLAHQKCWWIASFIQVIPGKVRDSWHQQIKWLWKCLGTRTFSLNLSILMMALYIFQDKLRSCTSHSYAKIVVLHNPDMDDLQAYDKIQDISLVFSAQCLLLQIVKMALQQLWEVLVDS
jgi:hypothetical protein